MKVLIVDDDPDIARNLTVLLGREGYLIDVANNGLQALEFLNREEQLPSLILLDLMMPGMNGIRFREEQIKIPRLASIPVVVMTADSNPEVKTAHMGAAAVLPKPFKDIESILSVVRQFVFADGEVGFQT